MAASLLRCASDCFFFLSFASAFLVRTCSGRAMCSAPRQSVSLCPYVCKRRPALPGTLLESNSLNPCAFIPLPAPVSLPPCSPSSPTLSSLSSLSLRSTPFSLTPFSGAPARLPSCLSSRCAIRRTFPPVSPAIHVRSRPFHHHSKAHNRAHPTHSSVPHNATKRTTRIPPPDDRSDTRDSRADFFLIFSKRIFRISDPIFWSRPRCPRPTVLLRGRFRRARARRSGAWTDSLDPR